MSYVDIRNAVYGGEIHHMPSYCATQNLPLGAKRNDTISSPDRDLRPSILMEVSEHAKTESYGSQPYNKKLQDLVEKCQFKEAQEEDIKDLKQFGTKYDEQVAKMVEYTNRIPSSKLQPSGGCR